MHAPSGRGLIDRLVASWLGAKVIILHLRTYAAAVFMQAGQRVQRRTSATAVQCGCTDVHYCSVRTGYVLYGISNSRSINSLRVDSRYHRPASLANISSLSRVCVSLMLRAVCIAKFWSTLLLAAVHDKRLHAVLECQLV